MHRIFVEKKPAFAHEARTLLPELRESLHLDHLQGLRVIQRYDIDGLSCAEFELAVGSILSEPQVDHATDDLHLGAGEQAFAVEYLPGQFDQRADSAAQCLQILTAKERPTIASATVYVLQGGLSPEEIDKVKHFIINSVDSHEATLELPESLHVPTPEPKDVESLENFNALDPATACKELGLAMSAADVAFCQKYFGEEEGRAPTLTEIRVLDTYWSDHCRHTTFLTRIADVEFDENTGPVQRAWEAYQSVRNDVFGPDTDRPVTLMDIALMGMRELRKSGELDNLEESDEINAASIVVPIEIEPTAGSSFSEKKQEEWLVMFKNETHNHPTEIEPFGGAATCLGGCIRDPLSGRSYVYQAMRVTGAANPLTPFNETLPGKLPQKKICQVAAEGYSSYGNQIGLATGQVAEVYHPGYVAKRMEIGAVVAAAPRSQVFRGSPATGDLILLIGGRTGRDGVGGATGSSKEHSDDALDNSAEVQKGDAPTERKVQRLFRHQELARKIKVCNDFGAGGVSVAIGEIAPSLDIDLDAVPKKYDGLDGTELAISESQERMAVCVDPSDLDFFIQESDKENLDCTHVATVADHGRLRINWRGKTIVDLSRVFLDSNGVQQEARIKVNSIPLGSPEAAAPAEGENLLARLKSRLSQLNHASQKGLGEIFDGSVGAGTVLWPFGGAHQLTPPDAMVAKLPLLEGDTDACSYMSWGFNPDVACWSPFHGAAWAVTESVCKAVAAGARLSDIRLTLQEYFPKLGDDPARWGLPFASLLGAFEAQHQLRLAAIGGKDSMSGSFNELDVPPTLVSFALAPGSASRARSPEFKQSGSRLSLIEIPLTSESLPDYPRILEVAEQLHQSNELLVSVKAIGSAGLGHAIATSCFGNGLGAELDTELDLFEPRPFSFLVEHGEDLPASLGAVALGRTTEAAKLNVSGEDLDLDELLEAWTGTLEPIYPTQAEGIDPSGSLELDAPDVRPATRSLPTSSASPRVIIPAFPGTNSEYDTAKAFAEAGATPSIQVFRNLTPQALEQSLSALAESIRSSEILMIPGGFSAGDEPDGSAKFIATVLRNPMVADAVMDLIKNRDGLILGICNGFQALVKTGLVPYGEIRKPVASAPTLAHNSIGRHVSCYVHTRVESNLSPWLAGSSIGDRHCIPVSHGEGRFVASEAVIRELARKGQIATRYVDASGEPTMDIEFNPNGSTAAVEGITSPCGKVFGKMGHTERRGSRVAVNIPGEKHQPLFKAGVRWFQ
ncbi:phosphoribosylformylglycinamidine synthase [Haloferula rosea]|uniref:Phosphoribosylformylglycinamidine synthase n=1 Tax=Haloferula rosea TaxID=490093 RepID=A0A934RE15_9BACT|nr:phosphoribosylformylglycinamidine synthase [Haloferula rosea]MBK1827381.1 phosphoribosylformylglycinamidine synthase [Haloferula rosea]